MNEIRNNIITISGQPVTGKSTTIKTLIKKLQELGYKEEDIHLESTGEAFRKYFNSLIEFINNIENKEKTEELLNKRELAKLFKIDEFRKCFSKDLARLKKSNIDFSNFTIEKANNMKEITEIRKIIDTIIDTDIKEKGKEINKEYRPNQIWIIDSRLAFSNIPNSFSVRLTSNSEVAAERLFNDKTRGIEDSRYNTLLEAKVERERRLTGEVKRYKQRYGIDLENPDNYDLIIDTSYASIEDISDIIIKGLQYYRNNQFFAKTWTSPKTLLPLQAERETLARDTLNFDEMVETLEKNGYNPSSEIEVVEVEGYKYIIEGHHRNFASAYIGKTLVPYTILAKDDETITKYGNTARERADSLTINMLYGHEGFIAKTDKDFSYKKMYPKIFEKLEEDIGDNR